MNTKTFTFYGGDGNKMGIAGTSISLEQGTYKVIGYLEGSKRLDTVAQFPIATSYYTVQPIRLEKALA